MSIGYVVAYYIAWCIFMRHRAFCCAHLAPQVISARVNKVKRNALGVLFTQWEALLLAADFGCDEDRYICLGANVRHKLHARRIYCRHICKQAKATERFSEGNPATLDCKKSKIGRRKPPVHSSLYNKSSSILLAVLIEISFVTDIHRRQQIRH